MARRSSFVRTALQISREIERQQKAALRAQAQAQRANLTAQREYQRAREREAKAALAAERAQTKFDRDLERLAVAEAKTAEKEMIRLGHEAKEAEIEQLNDELSNGVADLEGLLLATLDVDDYFDLDTLKQHTPLPPEPVAPPPKYQPFDAQGLDNPEPAPTPDNFLAGIAKPEWSHFLPPELSGAKKMLPWARKEHDKSVDAGKKRFEEAHQAYSEQLQQARKRFEEAKRSHAEREAERERQLQEVRAAYVVYRKQVQENYQRAVQQQKAEYHQRCAKIASKDAEQHEQVELFKQELHAAKPEAIVEYFGLVLEASEYPEDFPRHVRLAYIPESKQAVVEYDLPQIGVVPEIANYRYIKTKGEIASSPRPTAQRKVLYSSVVAQITLRTLHEIFEADRAGNVESIVFNGHVETIDPATGREVRPCLVTVRTTRDSFDVLNLRSVDPAACLRMLGAGVSKSPSEMLPVRPVVEFNMVDSRFIEETDIISGLDNRTNLMDLSPSEFEALIANLFSKMGLESKLTQSSRDGGVDCVAFDPRPVLGGKVVIQAKRYKHTVGVSAVRDLFGTMHNEGASKGILVTTSGYGKSSYEFVKGKPMELLTGSNLLHLLEEYAGISAKIEMPVDWEDPQPDTANED